MVSWSPATYLRFADERSRPFVDLTARIDCDAPRRVADLGCGPGQLTAILSRRWPTAQVEGVDSSPDMIEVAVEHATEQVRFTVGNLVDWRPATPVDVIVSNATLQWVPGHRDLLPDLLDRLAPDGWLAFQVPGNFGEPSHVLLRELAADHRFADDTGDVEWPRAFDATVYLSDLAGLGCRVDAWETTYLHVLAGPDPVFRWMSGTGARPILEALRGERRSQFVAAYVAQLGRAYPSMAVGTLMPFRRVFVVAQKRPRDQEGDR